MINISPNSTGLPGIAQAREIVGAIMTVSLILALAAVLLAAALWAIGSNASNPHLASRGKIGVLVGVAAAFICGASVALINFGWTAGQTVT